VKIEGHVHTARPLRRAPFGKEIVAMRIRPTLVAALGLLGTLALGASGQTRRVDVQLSHDFPDQRREMLKQDEVNGTRVYEIRVTGDKGESNVVITEAGDYLFKAVPTRIGNLPEPVSGVLGALFREAPASAQMLERTSYLVDVGGRRAVRLEIDAAGRLRDVISGAQLRSEERERAQYEKAKWRDGDAIAKRLGEYFEHARVKEVYHYPDAEGFYYAELTADRDSRRVQMVLDARKEVPFWRYELRPDELPRPVRETAERLAQGSPLKRVMRAKSTFYRVEQPAGRNRLTIDVRPTGDVTGVEGELSPVEERVYERSHGGPWRHRGRESDRDRDRQRSGGRYGE
jgi:hypothetical protein